MAQSLHTQFIVLLFMLLRFFLVLFSISHIFLFHVDVISFMLYFQDFVKQYRNWNRWIYSRV